MPFYFPSEVILVELKDGGTEQIAQPSTEELEGHEDLDLVQQLIRLCEDQSWLIQQQEDTIRGLQEQLADYEQEIYEIYASNMKGSLNQLI